MADKHLVTLAKTLTWLLLSTIALFGVSFALTGHLLIAAEIAIAELFIKAVLFFFHEKMWRKIHKKRRIKRKLDKIEKKEALQAEKEAEVFVEPDYPYY